MLKKISIIIIAALLIIIGIATAIPFLFKDTIISKVKLAINNNVNAKVNFNNLDLTIISSFPNIGLKLNDLEVIGIDSFATDTLANIKTLQLNLNLLSVLKGDTYEINSVSLIQPNIYAKVLKSGKANWDIVKEDTTQTIPQDTSSSNFKAALKKYDIENGKIIYDDASLNTYLDIDSLNHSGKGDFTQDIFILDTKSDIEKLTLKYAGVPYLNKAKVKADLPIEIDLSKMKFGLKENNILLNELILSLVGNLEMPNENDMIVDFKFNAQKSDLKNFLSLIPAIYANNFKDLDATGKFGFNGFAKGTYNEKSLPAFDLNFLIENGKIKYTSLPSAINNIQVKANIKNPDGIIDHTIINIPAFQMAFDKTPLNGKLLVKTPESDPFVDMELKGRLDLKQLTTIFPMEGITLEGLLDADVTASGNKSAIDKGQYESFKAAGHIIANQIKYTGAEVPKPVHINNAKMSISPRNITLSNLNAKVGKSDFDANGTVNNYLSYIFQENKPLQGNFKLNSNLIDINELMGPESVSSTATTPDTTKLTVIEVPKNIDFSLAVNAGRVLYDNYDIKNAKGALDIKNQTITFKNLGLQMLDGDVKMNGSYSTLNVKKPKIDIDFGIEKMSIQKAFNAFNTIKLLAPIAKYTNGVFSTNLAFNSDLGEDMMPIYSSINADGMTNIIEAVLQGFEPLNKLASTLNVTDLKKLELHNLLAKFKIEDGKLLVSPFNLKKDGILMNVSGSNGLDQTMDYKLAINIPREKLGGKVNDAANSLLTALNGKTGTNINIADMVKVNALVGGTITKPTIKLDLGDTQTEVKNIANQIIADKKAEVQAKAQAEVTKITDKAKEEIQQKTDTLKKQTEQKVKDEVKNKLNSLFNKNKTTE